MLNKFSDVSLSSPTTGDRLNPTPLTRENVLPNGILNAGPMIPLNRKKYSYPYAGADVMGKQKRKTVKKADLIPEEMLT
jgi:hypothetical protein